ncbi:hypothetical protein GOV13_04960 [Candidatus Pacearchaeota archaeon]|nr:hypothetical protein [Candidatus Pacearchaeota archaeon]
MTEDKIIDKIVRNDPVLKRLSNETSRKEVITAYIETEKTGNKDWPEIVHEVKMKVYENQPPKTNVVQIGDYRSKEDPSE